jgi:hypothetical protein
MSFRHIYITLRTGVVGRNGRMKALRSFRRKTKVTQTIHILPEKEEGGFKNTRSTGVI